VVANKVMLVAGYTRDSIRIPLGTLEKTEHGYVWEPSRAREDETYAFLPDRFFRVPGLSDTERMESVELFDFFKHRITQNRRTQEFKDRLLKFEMDTYDEWEYIVKSGLRKATDFYEVVECTE